MSLALGKNNLHKQVKLVLELRQFYSQNHFRHSIKQLLQSLASGALVRQML